MCRIAGIVTPMAVPQAAEQLALMIETMVHEPFYTTGSYVVPELGLYIGWVDHRGQGKRTPLFVEHGHRALIFAGEHFGDADTPTQPRFGVDVDSLFFAYDDNDYRCLRDLNGWFAGVLVDRARREALIFNDRYGLHRLYHARTNGGFVFASESKAILAICPETRECDPKGVGEFIAAGCVFGLGTLFKGIGRLPGGTAISVRHPEDIVHRRYFFPSELEEQDPLPEGDFYSELATKMAAVVPKYFDGTDRAAVSLTGGFDSRAILAFAAAHQSVGDAYTYNGLYRECADVRVARQVAHAAGYRHAVLSLDKQFLTDFPALAERTVWLTDGTLDITVAHELFLSARAREVAPVRVTGNYGGEVFRDVSTLKPRRLPQELLVPEMWPFVDQALENLAALRKRSAVSFAVFDEIPSSLFGRLAAAQSQLTVRTPYMDNALVALAYRRPRPSLFATTGWTRMIATANHSLAAIPTDRGLLGARSPLRTFGERAQAYLLFKMEWYYEDGMPAWLSPMDRAAVRLGIPLFFVGSHKIQHYRRWFRDHFAAYLDSALDSRASRSILNAAYCRRMLTEHRTGTRNRVVEIAAATTLELVSRLLVGRSYPRPRVRSLPQAVAIG